MEKLKDKKKNLSSKPNPDKSYLRFTGIAFELAAFNLICVWGGYELSERYSPNTHWILIVFVLLSAVGTIYYLFKRMNS